MSDHICTATLAGKLIVDDGSYSFWVTQELLWLALILGAFSLLSVLMLFSVVFPLCRQ